MKLQTSRQVVWKSQQTWLLSSAFASQSEPQAAPHSGACHLPMSHAVHRPGPEGVGGLPYPWEHQSMMEVPPFMDISVTVDFAVPEHRGISSHTEGNCLPLQWPPLPHKGIHLLLLSAKVRSTAFHLLLHCHSYFYALNTPCFFLPPGLCTCSSLLSRSFS